MKKSIPLLTLFLFMCMDSFAQLSTHEQPVSFSLDSKLFEMDRSASPIIMPELDMAQIEKEDEEDARYDVPPRFGYKHKVNYNLKNSGTWYELPNGDKLWLLNVVCPGALSVNFCYDQFWIPEGGKFFVYSKDKQHSIGAFTSKNNKGDRNNIRGFATGLVYGSDVILEYYQPKEIVTDAIISIDCVVHGYRYIDLDNKALGQSGNCMVNINCEEGQDWQNEKKAVALIIVNGIRWCTGSLINATDLDQKPLFLTANHCLSDGYDATGNANLDFYSFYWNYEAPGCVNVNTEPSFDCTSGAIILANNSTSDFALFKLTEDPKDISGFTPYYMGWDSSGQSGAAGVCIHHPRGDIKKISTVATQPASSSYLDDIILPGNSHWKVTWKQTLNGHGTTEKGSSGSPLLNADHKIIGQLHGGYANCGDGIGAPDWYGKFDVSWSGNNNSIYRRIDCWLDSLDTGIQTMEGLLVIPTSRTISTDQQLYSNISITSTGQLIIQSEIELMGNSRVIVEAGGKLKIDGGTLSNVELILKAGASLQIINHGTLDTRNGFEAPLGALVDIEEGQIL